jgi:hypothetical protein
MVHQTYTLDSLALEPDSTSDEDDDDDDDGDSSDDGGGDMYFQKPEQLLDIFAQLEERNLFLIQNVQETVS